MMLGHLRSAALSRSFKPVEILMGPEDRSPLGAVRTDECHPGLQEDGKDHERYHEAGSEVAKIPKHPKSRAQCPNLNRKIVPKKNIDTSGPLCMIKSVCIYLSVFLIYIYIHLLGG